ncbi:hypothetical protein SDC9_128742 [bioreactor metagenome]|uniref:Uncharacterized protein n=1 Tax=bioreactor metagenome TaxID=1076179 RepID=A0A645CXW2_9ZZZZ
MENIKKNFDLYIFKVNAKNIIRTEVLSVKSLGPHDVPPVQAHQIELRPNMAIVDRKENKIIGLFFIFLFKNCLMKINIPKKLTIKRG